ncbi:MAG: hypothetical protein D6675_03680 [Gemmatimonadetes bacterium]|nr:MAG: hypothetical protein D6675_03680 [Gemmatimonadota bacterium]
MFLWHNPLFVKEVRSRIRGRGAFIILTVYGALLAALIAFIYYEDVLRSHAWGTITSGRDLFYGLFAIQLTAVCVISPSLTAPSMTLEKEKQTLEMLLMTHLTAAHIMSGKLLSTLLFGFLLLILSLPFASIAFILGGVAPQEVIAAYGLMYIEMIVYGYIGYLCSLFFNQTKTATSVSFLIVLVLSLGTLVLGVMLEEFDLLSKAAVVSFIFPITPVTTAVSLHDPNVFSSDLKAVWGPHVSLWMVHLGYSVVVLLSGVVWGLLRFHRLARAR